MHLQSLRTLAWFSPANILDIGWHTGCLMMYDDDDDNDDDDDGDGDGDDEEEDGG